uniref:exodeoxyribonuclease III n=1 Tax=Labrus bergylta TaxID=56723 RepID=A0A3Q3G239_9LABR
MDQLHLYFLLPFTPFNPSISVLLSDTTVCDIIQLSAVCGERVFNVYTVPRRELTESARKVTGFTVSDGVLSLKGRTLVLTNSLREVLVSFIAFLQMLERPLVVGHNIRRFDCRLLARALDELDLRAEFDSSISGCVDTLLLAREMLKDRDLKSFRQENLVRELLGVDYKAHDALEDVRALQALYSVLQPTPELIHRHRFTLDTMKNKPAVKAAKSKVACNPPQQRPLWEHFRKTVKLTGDKAEDALLQVKKLKPV